MAHLSLQGLQAINAPQMMLALLQDDISIGSHEVDHLASEHDGTTLT